MDEAWPGFPPSPVGVGSSPQSVTLYLLGHNPPVDTVTVLQTAAVIIPVSQGVRLSGVAAPWAEDRSWREQLQWPHSWTRGTHGSAPSSEPKTGLLQESCPSEHNREPPPSHPPPTQSPEIPANVPKLGRALLALKSEACSECRQDPSSGSHHTVLLWAFSRGRLPFICKYLEPIHSPVPATYPPSCKTLSVPSKRQIEVPTPLEPLEPLRHGYSLRPERDLFLTLQC